MSKLLIKINDDKELIYPCYGYILGINNFSICFDKTYSIEEIKQIKKENNKKIFVSLNKMVFNGELKEHKELLHELDEIGLEGIIVGDIGALNMNLKTNIILDQLHLNNSYYSINHYYNNGVNGVVLTNDITKDEIKEISNNTTCLLFKQVFGLEHLSTSVRKLVSNYKKYANIKSKSKQYLISEEKSDDKYHIVEDFFGTHILSSKVLDLFDVKDELDIDYMIIDSYLLNKESFKIVADTFYNNKKDKIYNDLFNTDEGFINKKTIYKVKNNE